MPIGTNGIRRSGRGNGANGSNSRNTKRPPSKSNRPRSNNGAMANAKQNYERYMALARNAASTGNTVEIENFYQHAEHYFRKMREQAPDDKITEPV